jgi:voltage-gated potassium channel
MGFVREVVVSVVLVTLTMCLQCAGMAVLIYLARKYIAQGVKGLNSWRSAVLMIRFTTATTVLHFFQILLWTGFYRWQCLPSWESCFYFSATSYSTVGYGDVVLPQAWRLLGPVESVIGILMCGISVSALFAIATELVGSKAKLPAPRT